MEIWNENLGFLSPYALCFQYKSRIACAFACVSLFWPQESKYFNAQWHEFNRKGRECSCPKPEKYS